jgi:hypothetical protein
MTLFIPLLKIDTLGTNSVGLEDGAIVSPDGSSDNSFMGQSNSRELGNFSDRISAVSGLSGLFVRERQQGKNLRKVCLILLAG